MVGHPDRPLTIYDLAGCLSSAYPNSMTPRNIQKSFSVTGIFPNLDIFADDEYLSSYVTDRENIEPEIENVTHSRTSSPSVISVPSSAAVLAPLTPVLNDEVAMPITPEPISNAPVTITNAGTVTSLVLQPISNHDGSSQFVMNAETTTPMVQE